MKMSEDDKKLLGELCTQHQVNFEKVLKLLDKEREFEFKDRRTGIFEALREIIKSSFDQEVKS
ncbi:TPA: DNA modification system-associated small protein [Legionella pneumophila]|uniref:DNA modification system-associated small protein n=1 Tax=Legionella pneumophila TaxID=446 RepID=UPI0007873C13|nr:DNA modification system-associated small protein [Legionella pneumophila]HAU1193387.1 hypothetical protein [Legionella pneumophila]HBD7102794.1 hypothetical protein [Legionella pneumophila]HCO4740215.1 hypothetical protein [Legionella pneumophila]HEG4430784.1 hypothetical protein [Legionella pneumophila]HEG4433171.1 hypothetical protein [Legionella pneumophila]